jgi:phage terminase large subunit-like protein
MGLDLTALSACLQGELNSSFFADSGPFAREHYVKHVEAMAATAKYKRCTIFGANRVGKTLGWVFALACFLTGKYPHWWQGRRFHKPITAWAAGVTSELVASSIQRYLIGTRDNLGGFIRPEDIQDVSWGKDDRATRVIVKSAFGGLSELTFKTYDMRQERFQSATIDVALMDEEPPAAVYTEAVTRTATTNGLVLVGFTALHGVTPLIAHLLPEFADGDAIDAEVSSHWYTFIGWDDIPFSHLSQKERRETMASYLPHEIDARTKGIPRLGSGKVWDVDERTFIVPSFTVPVHWPRWKAIDPGFQDPTGILDFALDVETDSIYLVGEYRKNLQHLSIHADYIMRNGAWIPCVIDPAGANIADGERVFDLYRKALRNPCFHARKNITEGLMEVRDRMIDGRFFVFDTLRKWRGEYAQYIRDEKGRIVDKCESGGEPHHFDLMACTRYGVLGKVHAAMRPHGWRDERDKFLPQMPRNDAPITIDNGFFS